MTVLNIHLKDEEKKRLQKFIELQKKKSLSDFIRMLISEKLTIEKASQTNISSNQLPDFLPSKKYVAIINDSIVAVGDSPSEVSQIAVEKFPDLPITIKYTGPEKVRPIEYIFMSLSDLNCWKYSNFENKSYPTVPLTIKWGNKEKKLRALVDTAASLCLLKQDFIPNEEFNCLRAEDISTAAGIINVNIYQGTFSLLDTQFDIEFLISPISDRLPFQFLIGQNLLNALDVYFFGKKQIVCFKKAD